MPRRLRAAARLLPLVLVLALALVVGPAGSTAPSSVTLAGDFQSELGCSGDWSGTASKWFAPPMGGRPWPPRELRSPT